MLPRTPKFYLAAVGALVAAGVVGIVTVAAASPKPSASPSSASGSNAAQTKAQAYCDSFVNHLASNLGKKPDQVKKALTDSLDQTLADAVKAGDITQQQADAIKAKRNGKPVCAGALAGIGRGEHEGAKAHAGLAEIAKALGISPQELQQNLAAGKTVKDVAASKGMDEATFRNNLVNAVKSDLDPKVASGKLTQQQEDKILARLKTGPLPLWDSPAKRPGPGKASPKPSP